MKRFALLVILLLVPVLLGAHCEASVRDPVVYKNDSKLLEQMAVQTANALQFFVQQNCVCAGDGFTTKECQDAAKLVVLVKARAPYHLAMMHYLGGITDERPPRELPTVPDPKTLCVENYNE